MVRIIFKSRFLCPTNKGVGHRCHCHFSMVTLHWLVWTPNLYPITKTVIVYARITNIKTMTYPRASDIDWPKIMSLVVTTLVASWHCPSIFKSNSYAALETPSGYQRHRMSQNLMSLRLVIVSIILSSGKLQIMCPKLRVHWCHPRWSVGKRVVPVGCPTEALSIHYQLKIVT